MPLKYIYFTYDAIASIMQDRRFLSIEFPEGDALCKIVTEEETEWRHPAIFLSISKTRDGIIFHTSRPDKKRGLLFDLTSFTGFSIEKGNLKRVSSIIIKVLRFAVKYFEGNYLSQNEIILKEKNIALVYPYPYTRSVSVPKVVIDLNTSPEAKRKELKILTAYSYQKETDETPVSFTTFNKLLPEIQNLTVTKESETVADVSGMGVTCLESSPILSLDSDLGFEQWSQYLTNTQKDFIYKEFCGPERLEGPAGSGKTLSMCLRIIYLLRKAEENDEPLNIIFFTHSQATKEQIVDCLDSNCMDISRYLETDQGKGIRSVRVTTLQDWCARHLGINDLSENEYLDKDAGNSKILQLMYIEEVWNKFWSDFGNILNSRISSELSTFINVSQPDIIFEILQREFSEIIKGQAKSTLDLYLSLKRPCYAMPLITEFDKRMVFDIFNMYQSRLMGEGQFDTDDIVLSAMGNVNAPIWNRRRIKEGYDITFIDETHLFNLNEISIFHFINKPEKRNNIIFCIDRSQSIGDSYRADTDLLDNPEDSRIRLTNNHYDTLFRSSHDIAALALSILTSGAAMFTTLENPMTDVSTLSLENSDKCIKPFIELLLTQEEMIRRAFDWAQEYVHKARIPKNNVLIIGVDTKICRDIESYARSTNKPYIFIDNRTDIVNIKKGINESRFIISGIDNVGGLEFDAVIIVGADGNHVPPNTEYGRHIINFAWYNRLYVAVTRARYAVVFLGEKSGKVSPLLEGAINDATLDIKP